MAEETSQMDNVKALIPRSLVVNRRFVAIGLILSAIVILLLNVYTLRGRNLWFLSKPKGVDDRLRAVIKEMLVMRKRIEDKTRAMDFWNYTQLPANTKTKVVLGFTTFFKQKPWDFMNNSEMFNHWEGLACPYFQCRLTFDNSEYKEADAVLFHAFEMPGTFALANLKQHKPKHQKWVYFALENPDNNPPAVGLDNYFNWKANYRRDADFFSPYGYYYPVSQLQEDVDLEIKRNVRPKDRFVLWAASHCDLAREKYIKKLLNYIKVDIYGACAGKVGSKPAEDRCVFNDLKCDKLKRRYKFQLAFENSNCVGYVTEKYWRALELGIVPVVLGGSGYGKDIAVPGSFIDVMDFKTIKSLAEHLMFLDKDDEAYSKYFEWRKHFKIARSAPWTCTLCAALNINTKPVVIEKLGDYWSSKRQCGVTDKKINTIINRTK